ncbi:histone acetyltransferase KAT6A-like isoform X2 [Panonychus citri]|nr:histone acetyltransferase KAT6A-like isoform X2 [Panonychus citri]
MMISQQSRADQRNLGLSALTGGLDPVGLLKAVKFANTASQLLPVDPKTMVDTTLKTMEDYSPITLPQSSSSSGDSTVDETIKLTSSQLKLYLTQEQVNRLIESAGLASKTIDWKIYRFPLPLDKMESMLRAKQGSSSSSSSRLSIMSIDSYIPKLMSSLDGLQVNNYRLLLKNIETDMDYDEFLEYYDQLDDVDEGMTILPIGMKTGTIEKPPGAIMLIGLAKFSADRKQHDPPSIVPTILIGQVGQVSPLQSKSEPIVEESKTSTSTPETVVETPKNDPEAATILEANESPLPEPNVPIAAPPPMTSGGGGPTTQPQATFFPPQPSMNHQPQPQPQPRPMQRPPQPQQPRPNLRPPPPSFDGRPSSQQQFQPNSRPIPRPRMDNQG